MLLSNMVVRNKAKIDNRVLRSRPFVAVKAGAMAVCSRPIGHLHFPGGQLQQLAFCLCEVAEASGVLVNRRSLGILGGIRMQFEVHF